MLQVLLMFKKFPADNTWIIFQYSGHQVIKEIFQGVVVIHGSGAQLEAKHITVHVCVDQNGFLWHDVDKVATSYYLCLEKLSGFSFVVFCLQ